MRLFSFLITALLLTPPLWTSGCAETRRTVGGQCELNTDCQAPLVCRLSRCRNECLSTRDCGLGLRCVLANDGLGVCQLPAEATCETDESCPDGLVCTPDGCHNACGDDQRCVAGARCVRDDGDVGRCSDSQSGGCIYNSDCAFPLICTEGRCGTECAEDRDCTTPGHACVALDDCGGGPCACRHRCDPDSAVPCPVPGTACIELLDDEELTGACERTTDRAE